MESSTRPRRTWKFRGSTSRRPETMLRLVFLSLFEYSHVQMRHQLSDEAKGTYAHALHGANDAQDQHYGRNLPEVLDKLRAIDMERITDIRQALDMCIRAEFDVHAIIGQSFLCKLKSSHLENILFLPYTSVPARCHDDMRRHVDQVDSLQDSSTVVEQYKCVFSHYSL